jgi:hypothetical protein
VPLIKDDLEKAKEAAQAAAMPFYVQAGRKLIEAKAQLKHGDWGSWLKRHFELSDRTARLYMSYAGESKTATALPKSLHAFQKAKSPQATPAERLKINNAAADAFTSERVRHLHADALRRSDERQAWIALAKRLIDAGYKQISKELHPDTGGSDNDMALLNDVRKRLKEIAGA